MKSSSNRTKAFAAARVLAGGVLALLSLLSLVDQAKALPPQILFLEDFESGPGQWQIPGNMVITTASAFAGSHSQTFSAVTSGGDARTFVFPVTPGQDYYLHVAYMTLGGGGYIGIDQFDASMNDLGEQWLIGDGGWPLTLSVFDYNFFNQDPANLGVWKVYTQPYTIPANVHFIRIKTEDWEAGLPDNPQTAGVFFDNIEWSTSPIPSGTATAVTIDIKPGSSPNSINPKNRGKIPVAILTTDTFDATTVDPTTVFFGPTGVEAAPVHFALRDVDKDGDTDMILHFNTQDTGIVCGDSAALLTGETLGGHLIEGSDSIKTAGCK